MAQSQALYSTAMTITMPQTNMVCAAFSSSLLVEHGGGLFVGQGKASLINYLVVNINQMVIINYHGTVLLSRAEYRYILAIVYITI